MMTHSASNSTLWAKLFFAAFLTLSLQACAPAASDSESFYENSSAENTESETDKNLPDHPIPSEYVVLPLSWESTKSPERREWSLYLHDIILSDWSTLLAGADDIERFCPQYDSLDNNERANVWAALFSAMAKYESGYSPTSRMVETTMGTDPVTGSQVASEGLLQLSYQDAQWAKWCDFDWNTDKHLSAKDPQKSILDPYKNLYCGVGIMARQITKKNKIALTTGVYWAVLRDSGTRTKVNFIADMVKQLPFCQ